MCRIEEKKPWIIAFDGRSPLAAPGWENWGPCRVAPAIFVRET
jgi:hypothetical protein